MDIKGLSFDALPDIRLPFSYFFTATLFGVLSALLIFTQAEQLWISRWHGGVLALTHSFGLGVISVIMLGALLQLLPVVGGASFPQVQKVAISSLVSLIIGVGALVAHFLYPYSLSPIIPQFFLSAAFAIYLGALFIALARSNAQGATIFVLRFSAFSLVVVVILGVCLLAIRQSPMAIFGFELSKLNVFANKQFTDAHGLSALVGWVSLMIMAVSYQVVPMFHVAPSFPKRLAKVVPVAIFALLLLALASPLSSSWDYVSSGNVSSVSVFEVTTLIIVFLAGYGLVIANLLKQRKRQVPDTTVNYWNLAVTVLLALLLVLVGQVFGFYEGIAQLPLLLTGLFLYGFVFSVVQGLLIKILPFLSYTHLQNQCMANFSGMEFLPHMHQLLPKKHSKMLFIMHCLGLFSLVLAPFFIVFTYLFACLLLIEFLWLQKLIINCYLIFRRCQSKISQIN